LQTNSDKINTTEILVSLQDISDIFNLSYQTLNYYTSLGLLIPEKRKGNKRLYLIEEVKGRLDKMARLKNEGYPLRVIANILNQNRSLDNGLL